ncbi:MAG: cupin domain-containing protein [Pseudomonadota bacterium]
MTAPFTYQPGVDVGPLEDWPFDSPDGAYDILRGTPRASGRLDDGGPGHTTRTGIWRCTKGTFACTEQGDELMTVLSGRCTITIHATNQVLSLGPGDSAFLRDGARVTWDILDDLTKVFFAHNPCGY